MAEQCHTHTQSQSVMACLASSSARLLLQIRSPKTPKPSLFTHLVSSHTSLPSLRSLSAHNHKRFQRRSFAESRNVGGGGGDGGVVCLASSPDQLRSAREDVKELLRTTFCHPIMVRLGWHDAGTYDKNIEEWPQRGGANGSLRFEIELKHAANAGLVNVLKLLQPIKDKYPGVTYADLFQLASATAVEEAGGPKLPMKYGRVDVSGPDMCPEEGKLPVLQALVSSLDAGPPSPADHLRDVFYRMGLNDKEIVALSGAHTLGRSRPERSGWGKPETKYTIASSHKDGPGAPGGQSWTVQWLKFDNSYFKDIKERRDEDLLVLPTDAVLFEDPSFKVYAEKYAADQDAFFKDYTEAHAKLSNLGAKFDPPEVGVPDRTLGPDSSIGLGWRPGPGDPTLGFLKDNCLVLSSTDDYFEAFIWNGIKTGKRLSRNLSSGSRNLVGQGFSIEDSSPGPAPEKFEASKYSYGKRELSDSMKQKIRAEYEALGGSPDKPLPTNYFLNIMILIGALAILTSLLGN
ncbi:hypothetical protein Scep_002687 [Stephania cephalantha]|uniref:L-ascorbate peroxidase n=1 Tax=Stephania cephalantha TaxID=152367 RepID=A0AAP0LAN5_9MAGN